MTSSSWRVDAEAVDDAAKPKKKPHRWEPAALRASQARQNVARSLSEREDDENQPLSTTIAQGALGAADTFGMGLADEVNGGVGAQLEAFKALKAGASPSEIVDALKRGYRTSRDAQRGASAQAQDESPLAYGGAQLGATALQALMPGGAAGSGARTLGGAALRGAGTGAAIGGIGGFGAGEGDDTVRTTLTGAALGGALGAAGGAAANLAPRASAAARTGAPAAASKLEALLTRGLDTVERNPVPRTAAAVLTKGASEGALGGAKALRALMGKIGGAQEPMGPVANAANQEEQAFLREVMPDPFGAAGDDAMVGGSGVTRELAALKYRMGVGPDAPPSAPPPRPTTAPIPSEDEIASFGTPDEWEAFSRGTPATPVARPDLDEAAQVMKTGTRADRTPVPRAPAREAGVQEALQSVPQGFNLVDGPMPSMSAIRRAIPNPEPIPSKPIRAVTSAPAAKGAKKLTEAELKSEVRAAVDKGEPLKALAKRLGVRQSDIAAWFKGAQLGNLK